MIEHSFWVVKAGEQLILPAKDAALWHKLDQKGTNKSRLFYCIFTSSGPLQPC